MQRSIPKIVLNIDLTVPTLQVVGCSITSWKASPVEGSASSGVNWVYTDASTSEITKTISWVSLCGYVETVYSFQRLYEWVGARSYQKLNQFRIPVKASIVDGVKLITWQTRLIYPFFHLSTNFWIYASQRLLRKRSAWSDVQSHVFLLSEVSGNSQLDKLIK